MWEPAFCAGSQALWESGESLAFDFSPISTARHFHSETGKPAKSGPSALTDMLAVRFGVIRHISESRPKCTPRQILVQSHYYAK